MKYLTGHIASCIFLSFLCFSSTLAQNSLGVINPQQWWSGGPGSITDATISVKPSGIFTEVGLFLTFASTDTFYGDQTQLEIIYNFELPKNAMINDSWLWVGDEIVKADIRDRWSASFIYEGIVQRRQDPSILTKMYETNDGVVYELRVYPLFQGEERKVKISYLVPNSFSVTGQQLPIPLDIIRISSYVPDKIDLIVWPDEDWKNPYIIGQSGIRLEEFQTEDGRTYLQTDLVEYMYQDLSLGFPSVLQEGIFLKIYETEEDNYYQLVYLPTLDENLRQPNKVTFVLDYVDGATSVTQEEYFAKTTQFLLATLNSEDYFNIVYPTLSAITISQEWLTGSEENIFQAMEIVRNHMRTGFSILPSLLGEGMNFTKDYPSSDLFLISTSDEFGTVERTNSLVEALQDEYPVFPSVFVADLSDEPRYAFYSNGINYYGNQYLYTLLTQLSGGEVNSLSGNPKSVEEVLGNSFLAINGSFESFDLHTSVESGFCYSRFNLNSQFSLPSPFTPISQVGKYVGDLPFELSVAGQFKDSIFHKEYSLYPFSSKNSLDSLTRTAWAGLQIKEWQEREQTNEIIQRIMELSLESRVLSDYTAFLALEPSDTTTVCPTDECEDETAITTDVNEQLEADLGITLAPNPFTDQIIISGEIISDKGLPGIKIMDVLGREVKEIQVNRNGDEWEVIWDGTDSSGVVLPAGIYFLSIELEGEIIVKRIIKQ